MGLAVGVVVLAAVAAVASEPSVETRPQYDDTCLSCLCKAVGKNGTCVSDMRLTCVHLDTHGPFCISVPFWIDAGKPVLPGDNKDIPGAFLRCVEEPFCAVQTIRGYMETGPGLQDCDKNGIYNCKDLILTHLHGRYNCKNEPDRRVTKLEDCMREAQGSNPSSPHPRVSPPRRVQASAPGGRSSAPANSNTDSRVSATPGDSWSFGSYGRGASNAGLQNPFLGTSSAHLPLQPAWMNPYGRNVGNDRNIPRDSFDALQSGSIPSRERGRLHPDDDDGMGDHAIDSLQGNHWREIQDMMERAARLAGDSVRNANLRNIPLNSLPDSYDEEMEVTSESAK